MLGIRGHGKSATSFWLLATTTHLINAPGIATGAKAFLRELVTRA